jgi:hypothetical protein
MSVSVVLPSAGVSARLGESVRSMAEAAGRTGPDAEVLVVVNGRPHPDVRHLGAPGVRVVRLDESNVAQARNVGIAEARHDTVIFGDDGATVPPTWCTDLAAVLRDPRYPVVTAPVRVPVLGPVTAFLDYQRLFDAPPANETEALTATGALGLRRDRVPAGVRYDDVNMRQVGEDTAFGLALRAAGIRIRWLGGIAPARHLLPERIEEVTDRALRYGGGAGRVWGRGLGAMLGPDEVLPIYRGFASGYEGYRRFTEIDRPPLRAAFALYDYLFSVAWLVGYLGEAGPATVDLDGLRPELAALADRAAPTLGPDGWLAPPLDFARLDAGATTADPLIAAARAVFTRHVSVPAPTPRTRRPAGAASAGRQDVTDRMAALNTAWRRLRASGTPLDADVVDRAVRAAGFGFREGCAGIERSGSAAQS